MLSLPVAPDTTTDLTILCLGAHCDDIEIGCGATLLTLLNRYTNVHVHWHVLTSTPARAEEAQAAASDFCAGAASASITVHEFRDGYLPYEGAAIKDTFEAIKPTVSPDLIFTHYRSDAHQDHRLISELTWNTFREHQILEYEIPKWDGDLGRPSVFVDIDPVHAARKIELLQQHYNSQQRKHWFTDDLFHSLMRLRGMESHSPTQLAEAFYAHKLKLV